MISPNFNFSEFIEEIKNKDKNMIQCLAESEAIQAEKISEMKGYGHHYVEAVNGFVYFLRNHQKPYNISERDFQMLRVVFENLVAKNQTPPDILKKFD